jgi:hypothetical protein
MRCSAGARESLEHDRAAGEQRGADLVGDEPERLFHGMIAPDRADRPAHEQAEAGHRRLRFLLPRKGASASAAHCSNPILAPIAPCCVMDGAGLAGPRLGHGRGPLHDRAAQRAGIACASAWVRPVHEPSSNVVRAASTASRCPSSAWASAMRKKTCSVPESITSITASDEGATPLAPDVEAVRVGHRCGRVGRRHLGNLECVGRCSLRRITITRPAGRGRSVRRPVAVVDVVERGAVVVVVPPDPRRRRRPSRSAATPPGGGSPLRAGAGRPGSGAPGRLGPCRPVRRCRRTQPLVASPSVSTATSTSRRIRR